MFRNIMIFLMFLICTFIGYFIGENYKRRSQKNVLKGKDGCDQKVQRRGI